jgi:hypothetical protein
VTLSKQKGGALVYKYGCAAVCAVLVLLALAPPIALADQETVTLRWTPKPGDIMLYKMTMDGDLKFTGDVPGLPANQSFDYSIEGLVRQTVVDVAHNGDITSSVKYGQLKARILGQSVDMTPQLAGCDIRVIQTPKGELVGISGLPQGLGTTGVDCSFGVSIYPEGPVSVGTSWKTPIPIPLPGGGQKLEVVSTITGIKDKDGTKVANIKTAFDGKIDVLKMMATVAGGCGAADIPEDAKLDANFGLRGNTLVRVSDGRVLSADASGTLKMKGDLASFGGCAFGPESSKDLAFVMTFKMSVKDVGAG